MSTAQEIEMIMAETLARMEPMRRRVERMADDLLVITFGRKVCARRARILRRRGHAVVRTRPTSTGKARYSWMPRIRFTPATFGGTSA